MNSKRTMVLVADESGARFLENTGVGKGLHELAEISAGENEQGYEPEGRSQAASGMARHSFRDATSVTDHERNQTAIAIADAARTQWNKGAFDRLVVAAPPKMLGALRRHLDGALAAGLVADLDKDLMKVRAEDLPPYFEDQIVF